MIHLEGPVTLPWRMDKLVCSIIKTTLILGGTASGLMNGLPIKIMAAKLKLQWVKFFLPRRIVKARKRDLRLEIILAARKLWV